MVEFVLAHPNIAAAQTYHNNGGMILRGPGTESDTVQAGDLARDAGDDARLVDALDGDDDEVLRGRSGGCA